VVNYHVLARSQLGKTEASVFLLIATYVIYSAFLNYSRYGAGSAWDLLPHSDTLRDLYPLFLTD
jgi:hypothetical protein